MPHAVLAVLALLSVAALGAASLSAQAQPTAESLEAFSSRLKAQYPAQRIDAVALSPVPGLYEVTLGKNVAYVDATGRYFLFGHVWDMQSRTDMTAQRKASLDRVDPARLPLDLAMRSVRGAGTATVYVFADPQCGYCRQLEKTFEQMSNVTVYTFLLPILGPESQRLAAAVWCSPDRVSTWHQWMVKGVPPATPPATCEVPAARWTALAQDLGISATPAMVSADGRKQAGALSAPELSAWLSPAVGSAGLALSTTTAGVAPNPTTSTTKNRLR